MTLYCYDFEVFRHQWIAVFLPLKEGGEYTVVRNDPEELWSLVSDPERVFIGFNSKFYDQWIVKAICAGAEPEEVKELSDYLVSGGNGWEHPMMQGNRCWFHNCDIKDDMQMGLSLKSIEGHLGMGIRESQIPFDLDRPLTPEEEEQVIAYCMHDVKATRQIALLRKDYLQSKIDVGRMAGLSDEKALSMTNAKLTAALLGAQPREYTDEREYRYPGNLVKDLIPPEVLSYFDRMGDEKIPDEEVFGEKLEFLVGDCACKVGFGGIHGAIPFYREAAGNGRVIRNYDVASLYPSLMINCGYTSRSIPSPDLYEQIYHKRLAAKKSGDKTTANALKLVLNTTYGAMLNRHNPLRDPLMGRSVCVSGQLFLLELAVRYVQGVKSLKLIQINTDGIMVSLEEGDQDMLDGINREWEKRTGFLLEEDRIALVHQKDVNNYIEVKEGGSVKAKGGYLVRGIAPAGAFNVNNNAVIVAEAIREYLVHGTPVETTIEACQDIGKFQMVAKAGVKYREAYHLVDGEKRPVQRVNRVYASKDPRYGKLFKVKTENEATARIEMLPEHCIIDNDNRLTIEDVDKRFYIELAKKRADDFMGIKPEKKGRMKMATAKTTAQEKPMNVYQKLLEARMRFLEAGVKKTGRNMHVQYKYFELEDIVPVALPIMRELGLLPLVSFTSENATMLVINTENPDDNTMFTCPMRELESNRATNPVQAMGAAQTYMRRYLYMMALDVVEADQIDGVMSLNGQNQPSELPKAPATPQQREEVTKELTDPQGAASELQVKQLKAALKKLLEMDPKADEWVAQVAVETEGFATVTKAECEKLLVETSRRIEGADRK